MKNYIRASIILIIIVYFSALVSILVTRNSYNTKDIEISDDVKTIININKFGEQLKKVSLNAPNKEVKAAINNNYKSFVSPELIDLWIQEPQSAPGRLTSNSWPERIKITNIEEVGGVYNIFGDIIFATSDKPKADTKSFNLLINKEDKKIKAFNDRKVNLNELGLSIFYSDLFTQQDSLSGKRIDFWSEFSGVGGKLYKVFYLPETYFEGTNFSEAYITIASSSEEAALVNCTQGDQVMVNGYEFAKNTREEGAAGNFYRVNSYKKEINGSCMAIESVTHTTNIYNYPEDKLEEVNLKTIDYLLDSIIRSVNFELVS
jgi:hypothetical protein